MVRLLGKRDSDSDSDSERDSDSDRGSDRDSEKDSEKPVRSQSEEFANDRSINYKVLCECMHVCT